MLSPRPIQKLQDNPLSAVRDCIFRMEFCGAFLGKVGFQKRRRCFRGAFQEELYSVM
jgi:hypothetical protein